MKRTIIWCGVVAAIVAGCGKSSSSDEPTARGGTHSGGGVTSGGARGDAGGTRASGGAGASSSGGATPTGGAEMTGGAGTAAGSDGIGGAPGEGGASERGGTGGADSSGGVAGRNDVAGGNRGGGNGEPGGAQNQGGAATGCDACQPLEECWEDSRCVPRGVPVGAGFSIDATEVTRSQYAAWLSSDPPVDGQRDDCAWNDDFAPDTACMAKPSVCQGAACAPHPQPCIDFCDAAAYCVAIGRRLCGAIAGGAVASGSSTNRELSQWHNACTSAGTNTFAYGSAPIAGACNDALSANSTTDPVGAREQCQSPEPAYAGVFDLIGNVWEWEDNCLFTAQDDVCNARGGAYGNSAAAPSCNQLLPVQPSQVQEKVGFRCCSQ
jgi:formylglycine-generating enzyme